MHNFIPRIDNKLNLGSESKNWRQLFLKGNIYSYKIDGVIFENDNYEISIDENSTITYTEKSTGKTGSLPIKK